MRNHEKKQSEAAVSLGRLIRPRIICDDLGIKCEYCGKKQCYIFTIWSHIDNFVVQSAVPDEQWHSKNPVHFTVEISRSFLGKFQAKFPDRYIDEE
jgi:hypothetical protein